MSNTQVKKYADVGPYPFFAGKPVNPSALYGGYALYPEYKLDSSIVCISCIAYNDFPVTEFIEVVW